MSKRTHSRWNCSLCSNDFPDAESLQGHLDFDKSRVRYLLKELRKALSSKGCPAFNPEGLYPVDTDNGIQDQDSEQFEFVCPDVECKSKKRKNTYSNKPNLLRHYRNHVPCDEQCAYGAIHTDVGSFFRHLTSCRVMKANSTQISDKQLKVLRSKVQLLKQTRGLLNTQLGDRVGNSDTTSEKDQSENLDNSYGDLKHHADPERIEDTGLKGNLSPSSSRRRCKGRQSNLSSQRYAASDGFGSSPGQPLFKTALFKTALFKTAFKMISCEADTTITHLDHSTSNVRVEEDEIYPGSSERQLVDLEESDIGRLGTSLGLPRGIPLAVGLTESRTRGELSQPSPITSFFHPETWPDFETELPDSNFEKWNSYSALRRRDFGEQRIADLLQPDVSFNLSDSSASWR